MVQRKLVKNHHIEAFRAGRFEEIPEEALKELQRREQEQKEKQAKSHTGRSDVKLPEKEGYE